LDLLGSPEASNPSAFDRAGLRKDGFGTVSHQPGWRAWHRASLTLRFRPVGTQTGLTEGGMEKPHAEHLSAEAEKHIQYAYV